MADKFITPEEQKKLLQLWENAQSGNDDEIDAFENFREELGIEPDSVKAYLSVKQEPQTEQEKRLARKGKAADDKKENEALGVEKIAEAYGVSLKQASEDGDLEPGKLQEYLNERFVMRRSPNESGKDFAARNRNAFEALGLNWDNKDDRARVAKSLEAAERMDVRENLAEEMNSGVKGGILNILFPRTMEHATRDVLSGEQTEGYGKDTMLDATENGLQFAATPLTGPAGALMKYVRAAKALDKGSKAAKAVKGAGTLAGIAGDAVVVPATMETLDAINYDDPENPRSDFSGGEVAIGGAINAVTPWRMRRIGMRNARTLGEDLSKAQQAIEDIKEVVPYNKLSDYVLPYITNKVGRADFVRQIPGASTLVDDKEKETKQTKKKSEAKRTKYEKWSSGLSIPFPGDKDFEEFQEWKKKQTRKMILGKYLAEED
jgi:hypothetical protein